MTRGILESPNLDDRTFQDIVDEAKTLIPSYAPEWTDHNPSDVGIALIELFAWMTEGMIYRINRIPEKHYIEFLNLLGITRDPATPASAFLSFKTAPSSPPVLVPAGTQVATAQTTSEEAVIFETDEPVSAVATNLVSSLYISKVFFLKYRNTSSELIEPPMSGDVQVVPVGGAITLVLGFDQAVGDTIPLQFRFNQPLSTGSVGVEWLYSTAGTEPTTWPVLAGVVDSTDGLTHNGPVDITVPLNWAGQNPTGDWLGIVADSIQDQVDRSLFWVGIRLSNLDPDPVILDIEGIFCNAAMSTSALTVVREELLGTSDGAAFQTYELANAPLYQIPSSTTPYHHLLIEVREPQVGNTFGPWTAWQQVDEISEGAGQVYRIDPVRAMIFFGSFDASLASGFGTIPPKYSEIRATSYRYVAGDAKANVPGGTINVIRTPVASLTGASNTGPAKFGSDEESIDDAKRRAPEVLRNRYRAITNEDHDYLAVESTTDIAKVKTLGPRLFTPYDTKPVGVNDGDPWTFGGLIRTPGASYVIVIPNTPDNARPSPSVELIEQTMDYLAPRRPVNSVMQVVGPRYLPIRVIATVRVWQQAIDSGLVVDPIVGNTYRDELTTKATEFLHPLTGNSDATGFIMGDQMQVSDLFSHLAPEDHIGYIESIQIEAQTPDYTPPDRPYPIGIPGVSIVLADYEMVCSDITHLITVVAV
jgi:Baseplate J-like protein